MRRLALIASALVFISFSTTLAQQETPKNQPPKDGAPVAVKDGPISPEQLSFFEKRIRPVLAANCYQCHSASAPKIKGKLLLDTREGIRKGGESGPAVVPGNLKDSLLIQAIRYHDDTLKMPPKEKLPDSVIADFEEWVKMGAPDPRDTSAAKNSWAEIDIKKGKQFWSFQPPKKAAPPDVKNGNWPRTPIDRFLLAEMEAKGVTPVADVERHTLLRRIYIDLIGLPPTREEIEDFVNDKDEDAFAKVVDRLLASPHFGERWGRHWLDVARYGETSGKQVNFNYPHAWRYRDWVIAAFNDDMPYNEFVKEQVAGDLLASANAKDRANHQIATGFLALGPKDHDERNRNQFQMDMVDEQIDAMSLAFLGLTISCARCHDHKFDPIPQKDYYSLAGIFKSTQPLYGTIRIIQNNYPTQLVSLPADNGFLIPPERLSASERTTLEKRVTDLTKERQDLFKDPKGANVNKVVFNNIQLATVQGRLAYFDSEGVPKLQAMGVRDQSFTGDSPLYTRGEIDKPGAKVARGLPQVLTDKQPKIGKGSGRLELAQWLASQDNPLTARVMVNRVWLHLFGRGLVATPDNFGTAGQRPSHPQLLDYLAVTFAEDDAWSVKKLIRRMVLSRAYQLGGRPNAANYEIDPDNTLVWRMSKRRLDAEVLRDSIMAISGNLDEKPPVGSPVSKGGDGYTGGLQRFPIDAQFKHRAVYMPVVRTGVNEMLALFDFPDPSLVTGQRSTTTVPAQALFFLNNPWLNRQADAVAGQLLAKSISDAERVREAYWSFYGRAAKDSEVEAAQTFVSQYAQTAAGKQAPTAQHRRQGWTAFCQAMYGSAEFLYRN
jgi:hypothetical protein